MAPPHLGGLTNDWPPQLLFLMFSILSLWALHYHVVSNDRVTLPKQAEKGGKVGGVFTSAAD